MAPNSEETTNKMPLWQNSEEIVISGISGRFPESDNLDELAKNLFDNVDMITEDDRRWPRGLYGLPTRAGKIKDLSKFDAQFFGVHGKQANLMDPQARLLLELTYEAMVDAGVSPVDFRGSRTGVYVGACVSEVEEGLAQDVSKVSGYALTGCSRSMFANRISFTFDFRGPSYAIDTACSSSLLALQQAVLGLRSGQCDQAIVGGVNICLRPVTALQFNKLNMLAKDGKCKFMDAAADGYARAEACATVFLQKKSNAKRIYATVLHAKTNTDGNKSEGITFPSREAQRRLMQDVCDEANIDPREVAYVEAHGTGTPSGDPEEIHAIADVYGKDRKEPLLIGGVKSNLGHSEPASGLCSLAKILIAFENKCIPANLHLESINPKLTPLVEGILKPVKENTPFEGKLACCNSFGFGGVNVHIVVKRNEVEANPESHKLYDQIPRLVCFCSRTELGVNDFFDFIEKNPEKITREFLALANDVSKISPSAGMNHRGYMILKNKEDPEDQLVREVIRVPEKRPLWFVFSGMGSQWSGMARALMALPTFSETIDRCQTYLEPFNIDLKDVILNEDESVLDNTVAPFISIAAIQIGLVNILRLCNVEPDGIVGHSVGELGCAYADGCFDEKQMILSAYYRGKCVEDYHVEPGLMAAVGLGWQECAKRCPPGVVTACHNSEDSTTISGPYEVTKKFVAELKAENIFAREVKSCGVAFHSPHVGPIGPLLLEKLKPLLPNKKLRSEKWVSSSVPEERWSEDCCRYSSPEYYVNNLTSQVLFQEALKFVPKNAVLIEIAPHTLLQAILKRSLGSEVVYLGLCKRNNNAANVDYLLQTLGKLYSYGYQPCIENLYPKVSFPVPRNTPSLSSLIRWDHNQNWMVTLYPEYFNPSASSDFVVKVNIQENEDLFLKSHKIDGRIIYPATGYLMLAWKMVAKLKGQFWDKVAVEFENVTIHRATILPKQGEVKFIVRMMETSGDFSISESGTIVATGRVVQPDDQKFLKLQHIIDETLQASLPKENIKLSQADIYKELRVRGYDYGEEFRLIQEAEDEGNRGLVKYNGQLISFADNLLQMSILFQKNRALMLPVRFQSIRCDPTVLLAAAEEHQNIMPVVVDNRINCIIAHGLEIRGLKANIAPRRQGAQNPLLESYERIPYFESKALNNLDIADINAYLEVVTTLAKRVAKNSKITLPPCNVKDASDKQIESYENSSPQDFALYHLLMEQLQTNTSLDNLVKKYKKDLPKDLLDNVFQRERFLRPLLDVVCENSPKKLAVAESTTSNVLAPSIKSFILNNNSSVNYVVSHPQQDELADEIALDAELTINNWRINSTGSIPASNKNLDLIIVRDDLKTVKTNLETIANTVKQNGFVLILLRDHLNAAETLVKNSSSLPEKWQTELVNQARKLNLVLVAGKYDGFSSHALLFRSRIINDLKAKEQIVVYATENNYKWVDQIKTELENKDNRLLENVNVWVVANDTPNNGLVGLITCLKLEQNGHHIRSIFSANLAQLVNQKVDFTKSPFKEILEGDLVSNILTESSANSSYRHLTMQNVDNEITKPTKHAFLNVLTRGDLSSLRWFESPNKNFDEKNSSKDYLCHVYYSPLNFRDVMLASGKLPPDALPGDLALEECILGLEFAGRDSKGRRLMGLLPAKGLATDVILNDSTDFIYEVPESWTLEQAATVPVAYSTAYYALVVRGGLQAGESVLIHSGSGGVGQAAISICLSLGCQVFTTVGSYQKREFLKSVFPQLNDKSFANSRDTSFEQHVLRETKGRGVDIVLNSLSEEKLQASIRTLAQHGRFLEIGKYDLSQNNPVGMAAFLRNIAFHGILLDSLFVNKSNSTKRIPPSIVAQKQMVDQLMREGIRTGAVRPLHSHVFAADNAEEAFRFMSTGKHTGKVLLKIRDEEPKKICAPSAVQINALARTEFTPNKSYIIIGGLGGFALELSEWMTTRGCNKLVLVSRSGARTPYQHLSIKRLRRKIGENNLLLSNADVTSMDGVKKLIKEAKALGPVGGVFNLAMVLRDAMINDQTPQTYAECCAPKLLATEHLDAVTRKECPELEYFLCFSSTSCGRGNVGQTNYGFANSAMERICENRRRAGYPGVAIQWGAIGDVGVVLETLGDNETNIGGTLPQRIPSCLATLDRFLQSKYAVCSSIVPAEKISSSLSSKKSLVDSIAHILGIKSTKGLNGKITLSELGLDSLMGVEVKQTLERDYDVILSLQEIRALSVNQLQEIDAGNLTKNENETQENQEGSNLIVSELAIKQITEPSIKLNSVELDTPVFVIPPIDGSFSAVNELAKLLKRPVIGLNWVKKLNELKTIQEVAKYYIAQCKLIDPKLKKLDLIGYSMGAVIAFEMSLQTEVDQLILLDGTPKQTQAMIEKYVEQFNLDDPKLQHIGACLMFMSQLITIDTSAVQNELNELSDRAAINKRVAELITSNGSVDCKVEDVEYAISTYSYKMQLLKNYQVNGKRQGATCLYKAEEALIKGDFEWINDYGISEIVNGEVIVKTLKGNHKSFLTNNVKPLAEMINQRL